MEHLRYMQNFGYLLYLLEASNICFACNNYKIIVLKIIRKSLKTFRSYMTEVTPYIS